MRADFPEPPVAPHGGAPRSGAVRADPDGGPSASRSEALADVGRTPGTRTAFVLAGGGAKGAFEAGAVSYLVEEEGIFPEVITATSAGALSAAVLAQARTHQEMVVRTKELHDDLLAMTRADLIFGRQPWVTELEGTVFGRMIDHWVVEQTRPPVPDEGSGPAGEGSPNDRPRPVARDPQVRAASRSRTLRLLAQAALALPNVRRATRRMRDGMGSLMTLEPIAHLLRHGGEGISPIDPALVARPGLDLRLAVVALSAGRLRYVTGQGTIVAADGVTPVHQRAHEPVDLVDAVLASSSVPMVFPPRRMAGDAYVDGGVVDNVPVAAAAALGATRIFAILAVPLEPPADPHDYSRASAPAVLLRALGAVSLSERQRANLATPLPPGTELVVIDPVVDVVGPFDVAQGLMLLNMDYGWMRAADVCAEISEAARRQVVAATDAIARARTRAWHLEDRLWRGVDAAPERLEALVRCKRTVRDALSERKGLGLPTPDDAPSWWSGYEVHRGLRPARLPEDLSDWLR